MVKPDLNRHETTYCLYLAHIKLAIIPFASKHINAFGYDVLLGVLQNI
jgi:hypothetical protein